MLAARVVHPDWIATSGLSVDQARPAAASGEGHVEIRVEVLRAGRTAVVLAHEVADGDGRVGSGTMTFTRLHRREGNPQVPADLPRGKAVFASDGPLPEPVIEAVGLRVDQAAATAELDLTDTVRNSLGSVQGGMLGLVAEAAAEAAGSSALRSPARVLDLALDYVAVARTGPVRAVAEVVRVDGPAARVRVRVDDVGAGRLAVIAHAGVVIAP
jgi:acyl-coenzyme A thioesterase PaaI-like protein